MCPAAPAAGPVGLRPGARHRAGTGAAAQPAGSPSAERERHPDALSYHALLDGGSAIPNFTPEQIATMKGYQMPSLLPTQLPVPTTAQLLRLLASPATLQWSPRLNGPSLSAPIASPAQPLGTPHQMRWLVPSVLPTMPYVNNGVTPSMLPAFSPTVYRYPIRPSAAPALAPPTVTAIGSPAHGFVNTATLANLLPQQAPPVPAGRLREHTRPLAWPAFDVPTRCGRSPPTPSRTHRRPPCRRPRRPRRSTHRPLGSPSCCRTIRPTVLTTTSSTWSRVSSPPGDPCERPDAVAGAAGGPVAGPVAVAAVCDRSATGAVPRRHADDLEPHVPPAVPTADAATECQLDRWSCAAAVAAAADAGDA